MNESHILHRHGICLGYLSTSQLIKDCSHTILGRFFDLFSLGSTAWSMSSRDQCLLPIRRIDLFSLREYLFDLELKQGNRGRNGQTPLILTWTVFRQDMVVRRRIYVSYHIICFIVLYLISMYFYLSTENELNTYLLNYWTWCQVMSQLQSRQLIRK